MRLYPEHASLPLEQLPTPDFEEPEKLFYGGPDDEAYSARSPEEYLIDLFDGDNTGREVDDIEVCAYRRRQVEPEHIRWWASDAWELFVERFEEEFGGGDDDCYRPRVDPKAAAAEARDLLAPILERLVRRYLLVWQCEEVVELRRTYTAAEVRRIVCPVEPAPPYRVEVVTFPPRGGQ